MITQDRRPRERQGAPRDLRHPGSLRQVGDAHPDRAEARRDPPGRPEQALQAHSSSSRRSATTPSPSSTASRGRSSLLELVCATTSATSARSSPAASKHELRQAERRAHVSQGYLIALDNLDAVIALIRASQDVDEARQGLIEQFELSEIQAQAILDLRLARLTALERKRIQDEFADLEERIAELRAILSDEVRIDGLIREELLELKQIYTAATTAAPRSSQPRRSSSSKT